MLANGSPSAAIRSGTLVTVATEFERQLALVAGRPARIVVQVSRLRRCLFGLVQSLPVIGDGM